MSPREHNRESERLAALHRFEVLDTPAEREFDAIVELAARICDAPVSLVSLVDSERQWFKAKVGLDRNETPRDQSICAHAILEENRLEIADTALDPRTADNPLCLGAQAMRFYAGAVLKTNDGLPVGSLCVIDYKPRELTDLQRDTLQVLADQVMTQLELRATIAREQVLRKEIDHRVKNSLQAVGSFVALERRSTGDPACQAVLASVQQQVQTVAALHEQIGTGTASGEADIGRYLESVVDLLSRGTRPDIAITRTFEPHTVTGRQATALAMIVNELAANAIKHSFKDRGGTLTFTGTNLPDGGYRLLCEDDGSGDDPAEPNARVGLGMTIIGASVAQLLGTMTTDRGAEGCRTEIIVRL